MTMTSPMDVAARKEHFFAVLAQQQQDACWIVKPENVRYLTGFHGADSTLLASAGRYVLLTDRRYEDEAPPCAVVDDVVLREAPMAPETGRLCARLGVRRLCIAAANVSCAFYKDVGDACGTMQLSLLREGLVEGLRLCKRPLELDCIRRSIQMAECAFQSFCGHLSPGETERWHAARLEWELRCAGADDAAFDTICASGDNAARPHARPTGRLLTAEDAVLVDWGAQLEGYHSDLTRVVVPGTMPRDVKELLPIVLAAQEAAWDVLGPDTEAAAVDAAARNVIEQAGYGQFFSHGLGHGVGLEVHEAPSLAPGRTQILAPGMVVTVEPAIYLPGRCGVRIEDMACITGTGAVRLSTLERSCAPVPAGP